MKLTREEFEDLVVSALKKLPGSFKKRMENVDVVVEDRASPEILEEMGLRSPYQLLGLYQGVPLSGEVFITAMFFRTRSPFFNFPLRRSAKHERRSKRRSGRS